MKSDIIYPSYHNPYLIETDRPLPDEMAVIGAGHIGPDIAYYIRADRVSYEDGLPWPATADGQGDSLNRIGDTLYGNDPANFNAAPPTPGQ